MERNDQNTSEEVNINRDSESDFGQRFECESFCEKNLIT